MKTWGRSPNLNRGARSYGRTGGMTPLVLVCLSLFAAGCASVPTPSGRPELKVELSRNAIKSRITERFSLNGWMTTANDDGGVSFLKPFAADMVVLLGPGQWSVRFDLLEGRASRGRPAEEAKSKSSPSPVQIRATCYLLSSMGAEDASGGRLGLDVQRMLEREFKAEAIDGPYLKGGSGTSTKKRRRGPRH